MAVFDLGEGRGSLALAAEDALSGDATSLLARPASQLAVESSLEQFSDIRKGVRSLSVAERVERARLVTGDTQRAYTSSALRATTDLGKGGVRGGPASVGTSGFDDDEYQPGYIRPLNAGLALVVLPSQPDEYQTNALAVQREQAIVSKRVATVSNAKLQEAAGEGLLQVMDAMSEHLWVDTVQLAGLTALHNLALKVEKGSFLSCASQGVRACVAAMNAHTRNEELQSAALSTLRTLAALVEPGEVMDDGIEAAVSVALSHPGSAALQELSLRTLTSLLTGSEHEARSQEVAVAVGALEASVEAMNRHPGSVAVHEEALGSALLLVTMDPEQLASAVPGDPEKEVARVQRGIAAGTVSAVVAALRTHVHAAPVLILACRVLKCTAGEDATAAAAAAGAGACEALIEALRAHRTDETLAEVAPAALRTLISSPAAKLRACDAGALESLCLAMFAFPESRAVQAACAGALKSLAFLEEARNRPSSQAAVEGLLACLGRFGVGRAGGLAEAGDVAARDFAADCAGALANFMSSCPANQERLFEAGGVKVLVDVMISHLSSADVCEACCAALWALAVCSDDTTLIGIGEEQGADAIVRAMRAHPNNPTLQRVAASALRNIAVLPASAAATAAAGGVEAILSALRLHGCSAALQETLLDSLAALCTAGGERVAALAASEGALLVSEAAVGTRFPHHAGVRRAAIALDLLVKPHGWHGRGSELDL